MTPAALIAPPRWTPEQLGTDRRIAIEDFRRKRMEEPLEVYLEAFDQRQAAFEDLLETTVDLTQLADQALSILTDPRLFETLRYVSGPPVSEDDLKTLADVNTLSPRKLRASPELARRLIDTVMLGVDRRRFPWIAEEREPSEEERVAAVLASAALIASQRTATERRSEGKAEQERLVEEALIGRGLQKVPVRPVLTLADAPAPGTFCREAMLGNRKADFIIGLFDRRIMGAECKVSNSALNSIKRLNNDAAAKAEDWTDDFGARNVVPAAVLTGVYKLSHLENAQRRGLTLFWAHDLPALLNWIDRGRPGSAS
jgi:hypothetical protein